MSKLEVDAIEPQSGTSLTLGASGDTITIPSGATITNSGTATGFGRVLQVVSDTDNANTVVSSTSYADTGLTASITPSSASNKILILVSQDFQIERTAGTDGAQGGFKLLRDATTLYTGSDDGNSFGVRNYAGSANNAILNFNWHFSLVDSPNTTSAITYKTQTRTYSANSTIRLNNQINGTSISCITLLEIKA
jgi:hypothetical protein